MHRVTCSYSVPFHSHHEALRIFRSLSIFYAFSVYLLFSLSPSPARSLKCLTVVLLFIVKTRILSCFIAHNTIIRTFYFSILFFHFDSSFLTHIQTLSTLSLSLSFSLVTLNFSFLQVNIFN